MSFNENELITNEEMNELIKIGKYYSNKNIEYIKNNIKNINLNFNGEIQYKLHDFSSNSSRGYSKSDLSYILIGTIVGEVYLRDGKSGCQWGYGSVTATQTIIKVLEREAFIDYQSRYVDLE